MSKCQECKGDVVTERVRHRLSDRTIVEIDIQCCQHCLWMRVLDFARSTKDWTILPALEAHDE